MDNVDYKPKESLWAVDDIVRDNRFSICKSCNQYNSLVKLCTRCGCFMPAKTWLKGVECPEKKW